MTFKNIFVYLKFFPNSGFSEHSFKSYYKASLGQAGTWELHKNEIDTSLLKENSEKEAVYRYIQLF